MEKASAAGGEPALSSDTRRCTLGSPGRIGRKEGGKEERRALAAWPGGPAVGVKALRTQTASALHSGAIKHVQHAPCVNRLSISHSSVILSGPSVRPAALAGSSGPVLLGRRTGFFFLRPSSQACRGLQKREDSKRSIGAGRSLQPRCLLACCLRAEFKKTARNCLISQPCRGRSFVLGNKPHPPPSTTTTQPLPPPPPPPPPLPSLSLSLSLSVFLT